MPDDQAGPWQTASAPACRAMGHDSMRTPLIYQYKTQGAEGQIADSLKH
jgi:hypothetical protein